VKERLILALMFCAHALIMFHEVGSRFLHGHHGWNAAMRSVIARSYLEFGLWETRFLPYKTMWPAASLEGPIHWNHPPAINLATAASFVIFGETEWAARLPSIFAGLALFFVFFAYGKTLAATDERRTLLGIMAAGVFMWTPVQMLFGNMVNYEPPIIFFAMLGWVLLVHDRRALGILCFVAAVFVDWSACFIAAGAGVALLARWKWKEFLGLGISTSLMFGGLFAWLQSNADGKGLLGLGERRSSGISWEKLYDITTDRFIEHFGWPLLVLAGVGLLVQLVRRRPDPVVITFILGPCLYFGLFKQAAHIHNFYILLFMPAVVISAVIALRSLVELTDWLDPRLPLLVGVLSISFFAWQGLERWPVQHLRRYAIEPPRTAGTFPNQSRLLEIEVFRWVHQNSEPDDVVALHHSLRPSLQARYYLYRKYLMRYPRIGAPRKEEAYRFLIVARREVKNLDALREQAQILWASDYMVFDFGRPGEPDIRLAFEELPDSFFHRHFISSLYPPHQVVQRLRDEPSPRLKR